MGSEFELTFSIKLCYLLYNKHFALFQLREYIYLYDWKKSTILNHAGYFQYDSYRKNSILLDTIESALEDMRNGKVIIVVDDEDRENEGDFICACLLYTSRCV